MGIAANQQRRFLDYLALLRPHLTRDSALPRRIKELLGRDRAIGARDRRLYRELIYTTLRYLPWIEPWLDPALDTAARIAAWLAPEMRDTANYRRELTVGWPSVPESLAAKASDLTSLTGRTCDPQDLLPGWFREECPLAFEEPHLSSLLSRAPIWVRLQCQDRERVLREFLDCGWVLGIPSAPADAVCLPPDADVAKTDVYRRGFVEIQDLGSQFVLAHASVVPGQHWLDACAGAGGKTLQLARLVSPGGQVDAADIRLEALAELTERARRGRAENIRIMSEPLAGAEYDGVLVDAPCSGTGTWRRQPHLKWLTRSEHLNRFAAVQLQLLRANAPRVRPGGVLVYATCSLARRENLFVAAEFAFSHPDFTPEPPSRDYGGAWDNYGTTLLPGTHNTDGFYVAVFRRRH